MLPCKNAATVYVLSSMEHRSTATKVTPVTEEIYLRTRLGGRNYIGWALWGGVQKGRGDEGGSAGEGKKVNIERR